MTDHTVDVVIVGSGFAGLGAAVRLTQAGRPDFLILEKGDSLGGTWRDNTYPGCACDVQSHLYSFSFAPNPNWTRLFARQPEIRAYLEGIADRYRLRDRIRFGAAVVAAKWDGARWNVRTADGTTVSARVAVWGTGALHEPSIPDIDGLTEFTGTAFHSAQWDHDHDLRGERVAVIGTGASAIQFVPAIQPDVAGLTLFQRTAPWVLPKPDRAVPGWMRALYRAAPPLQKLHRALIYGFNEARVLGFRKASRMAIVERYARAYLDRTFADRPDLKAKVTPDFRIGCKRILMSNDYYRSLKQPNVDVVTEKIIRVTPTGVLTADGVEHEVDTIIFGTGFKVGEGLGLSVPIVGRDGEQLADVWRDGTEAFLGTTIAGFPNLFVLTGPNTGLGHSSMVYMIESQLNYLLDALRVLDRTGARAIDTRRDRQDDFNAQVQGKLEGSVWTHGGCASWYLDEHGKNRTLWPDYTFAFRRRTRKVRPGDHVLVA
ncbi:flavin-containing monooxygenase [Pseudonocardia nigra]|uniref:flavin-containing monooxygenase n=1 Tax=Pseudonocardia nigra TaxID=1921578 RepID=UPI001C5E952E|nr:NAD(P)/FAD-dependent oxidoreductase [Pseudonocardia nigra]